jgi:hypothetical protein
MSMVAQPMTWGDPDYASPQELSKLISERRKALEEVAHKESLLGYVPASERVGWTAHIEILERLVDGSLKAQIVVRTPTLTAPYLRRVRLVTPKRLKLK